jgi:hypothetical protein
MLPLQLFEPCASVRANFRLSLRLPIAKAYLSYIDEENRQKLWKKINKMTWK